ncbi:interleukin-1 alpha [Tamandua tetradactyla]|uniref:interleukin-1 alpha n=1 Tax=Tamandua tetradactyla TaxID=48850 RepID=UPI004053BA36
MARVPDLFEDLKSCYREDGGCGPGSGGGALDQRSFYEASYGARPEGHVDKCWPLSAPAAPARPELALEESVVVVTARGKVLKKRRRSLSVEGRVDGLEAPTTELEAGPIQPRAAGSAFRAAVRFSFTRVIKSHFTLTDDLAQSLTRDPRGPYLAARALHDLDDAVKFDMGAYKPTEVNKQPVTLRISTTRLFVSAQDESEPVLLKEMPETPKVITGSEASLLFFWERYGSKHYFRSVTRPELFIASKEQGQVHMARGQPSVTDFQIQGGEA